MKNILSLLLLFTFSLTHAQETEIIDANNVRARLHSSGLMFRNLDDLYGYTLLDKDKNEIGSTMVAGHLWFSNLHQTAYEHFQPSFFAGPLDSIDVDFNKVWKVKGKDIKNLIDDLSDGTINYDIAEDILSWPAAGNSFYNGKLDNKDIAPFRDINDDGIYNPYEGDYPIIGNDMQHVIPQEMLFCMNHVPSYFYLKLEYKTVMYTLSCDEKNILDNTVFTRHYIKPMDVPLDTLQYSFFFDQDIGCPSDDYIGFDFGTQTAYSYNRSPQDNIEHPNCEKINNYTEILPSQGTTLLNGSFDAFITYYGNLGFNLVDSEFNCDGLDYNCHNIINGFWGDGTPLTMGGNGYNPGSTDTTLFAYPGNPLDGTGWIQNVPDSVVTDMRGVATITQSNVQANDIFILDMAHHFALDPALDNIQIIKTLLKQAEELRQLHESNYELACFSYIANEETYENLVVYPNPAKDQLNLVGDYNEATFYIYNFLGKLIKQGTVNGQIIDISDLNQGLYTLVIKGADKTSSTKFMVE